jgi:hypothetical protein
MSTTNEKEKLEVPESKHKSRASKLFEEIEPLIHHLISGIALISLAAVFNWTSEFLLPSDMMSIRPILHAVESILFYGMLLIFFTNGLLILFVSLFANIRSRQRKLTLIRRALIEAYQTSIKLSSLNPSSSARIDNGVETGTSA